MRPCMCLNLCSLNENRETGPLNLNFSINLKLQACPCMCLNLCSLNEKPRNWLFKRKYRMCVAGCVMPHMLFSFPHFFLSFFSPAFNSQSQYGARLLFLQELPDLITRCPAEHRRFPEFFKDTVHEIFCGLFGSGAYLCRVRNF
jgi:hypothetical protein